MQNSTCNFFYTNPISLIKHKYICFFFHHLKYLIVRSTSKNGIQKIPHCLKSQKNSNKKNKMTFICRNLQSALLNFLYN